MLYPKLLSENAASSHLRTKLRNNFKTTDRDRPSNTPRPDARSITLAFLPLKKRGCAFCAASFLMLVPSTRFELVTYRV
jgi:hypothetical protein